MTLKDLIDIYGEDKEVYFKVYSCGQSSSYELTPDYVEEVDGKVYIKSDLN